MEDHIDSLRLSEFLVVTMVRIRNLLCISLGVSCILWTVLGLVALAAVESQLIGAEIEMDAWDPFVIAGILEFDS